MFPLPPCELLHVPTISFSFLELRQVMDQVNLGIPNVLENAIQSQAISHCSQSHRLTHLLNP